MVPFLSESRVDAVWRPPRGVAGVYMVWFLIQSKAASRGAAVLSRRVRVLTGPQLAGTGNPATCKQVTMNSR
jgi:hypothetical protein